MGAGPISIWSGFTTCRRMPSGPDGGIVPDMRRCRLLVVLGVTLAVACCLCVRYQRLGWGGYWSIGIAAP